MSNEQEKKHTELPWIISADGNHIAHKDKTGVAIFINPEDGRFAVYACNSHYALKKENEELRETVGEMGELLKGEYRKNIKLMKDYYEHSETYKAIKGRADHIKSILNKAGITV